MALAQRSMLTLPQLAKVAGVEYRTLHAWLRRGLLRPSVQQSSGTGTPNLFSAGDAENVRIIADLRRAGASFEQLEQTARRIHGRELPSHGYLIVNGSVDVVEDQDALLHAIDAGPPLLVYALRTAKAAVRGQSA
jgi:DNA-binding transcriptional MerR regulator